MLNDVLTGSEDGLKFSDVPPRSLACGIVFIDEKGRISAFNPAAEQLTGLPTDRVLNQPLTSLSLPLRQIIEETLSTSQPQDRQINHAAEGQDEFTLHITTALTPGPDGSRSGVVVVLNDLSVTSELEQSMRRLDRLASIGTLSASMAHEIKNALVAVMTFLDLLIQQNKDAELASMVRREIRRIDSIVSQMLRFAGPAKPTFAPLRLHDVLEQSLRLVEPQLAGKKIRLRRSLAASPDLVQGDGYQLEQVFLNFFLNAIEAMGANGELSIATDLVPAAPASPELPPPCHETELRLRIKDSGVGIPAENIARLFDTFFTTKKGGTGLGLTITRRIIKEHSGTIHVESEPNQGTTFTILLPCAGKPSELAMSDV